MLNALSFKERQEVMEKLWEPAKIYGNIKKLLRQYEKHDIKKVNFKKRYIILWPGNSDFEAQEQFVRIQKNEELLNRLYALQEDHSRKCRLKNWQDVDVLVKEIGELQEKISLVHNSIPTISDRLSQQFVLEVKDILKPLSGYWKGVLIMNNEEFETMTDYTLFFIENGQLPENIKAINANHVTLRFLKKTFHIIFSKIKTRGNRRIWANFLHKVFSNFRRSDSSLETTYKTMDDYDNYLADKEMFIHYRE